jgi:inhibitor of growth protein 4
MQVDRHVRSLDTTIKEHESSIAIGLTPGTHSILAALPGVSGINEGIGAVGEQTPPRRSRKKKPTRQREKKPEPPTSASEQIVGGLPSNIVHIPVNPHEPRYCYCNEVSYGEVCSCIGLLKYK